MDGSRTYRRGFLVHRTDATTSLPSFLKAWVQSEVGGWRLLIHPEAPVKYIDNSAGRRVVAIGDVFVAHGNASLDDCLRAVAAGDRLPLDDLSGRFALFVFAEDTVTVLHDPLGTQTVFYRTSGDAAGSHAALIADVLDIPKSRGVLRYMATDEYKSRTTRFLPGDLSLFDEVRLLVPNNELNLPEARTRRYWPHRPVASISTDDAFAVWDEYFTNYARYIAPRYRLVLGLTGGMDSRALIATLRSKGAEPRYETWDAMPAEERSRIPAMVEHLQGPHRWVDMKRRSENPEFRQIREAARSAAGFTRGTPLLPAQIAEGSGPRDLFLYGHGSAVASGAFSLAAKPWLPEDPLKRAYALYSGTARHNASPEYKVFTLKAFTEFFDNANYANDLHGCDIGDLLYWEHRMANWASLQIAAFAVAVASHGAFNSRRLFESFWGIPGENRLRKGVHHEFMARYDPVLATL